MTIFAPSAPHRDLGLEAYRLYAQIYETYCITVAGIAKGPKVNKPSSSEVKQKPGESSKTVPRKAASNTSKRSAKRARQRERARAKQVERVAVAAHVPAGDTQQWVSATGQQRLTQAQAEVVAAEDRQAFLRRQAAELEHQVNLLQALTGASHAPKTPQPVQAPEAGTSESRVQEGEQQQPNASPTATEHSVAVSEYPAAEAAAYGIKDSRARWCPTAQLGTGACSSWDVDSRQRPKNCPICGCHGKLKLTVVAEDEIETKPEPSAPARRPLSVLFSDMVKGI